MSHLIPQIKTLSSKQITEALKTNMLDGDTSPVEIAVLLKKFVKAATSALEDPAVKQAVLTDAMRYGDRAVKHMVMIEVTTTHTSYDYSQCGHPRYDAVIKLIAELTETRKAIEDELKGLTVPREMRVPTIEQIEHNYIDCDVVVDPPTKKTTTGVKFTT